MSSWVQCVRLPFRIILPRPLHHSSQWRCSEVATQPLPPQDSSAHSPALGTADWWLTAQPLFGNCPWRELPRPRSHPFPSQVSAHSDWPYCLHWGQFCAATPTPELAHGAGWSFVVTGISRGPLLQAEREASLCPMLLSSLPHPKSFPYEASHTLVPMWRQCLLSGNLTQDRWLGDRVTPCWGLGHCAHIQKQAAQHGPSLDSSRWAEMTSAEAEMWEKANRKWRSPKSVWCLSDFFPLLAPPLTTSPKVIFFRGWVIHDIDYMVNNCAWALSHLIISSFGHGTGNQNLSFKLRL